MKFYYNSGYFVKVVDTVGAGDSLAQLLLYLFGGKSPKGIGIMHVRWGL
jgi:fructokinase